jgi:hypothetical protein
LLLEFCRIWAIFLAFSNSRRSTYERLFLMASPINSAGLTLRADDGGLLLLAGLVDDEGGALGFLLGDLLGFNGSGKFGGEGEVLGYVSKKLQKEWNSAYSQRNVIKHDVESRRSPHKVVAHES